MPTYDHAPCFSFVYRSLYAVLKCCCCLRAPGIDTCISLLVILGVSVTWKNNQLILAVHQAWLCSMSGVKGHGLPFGHGHNGRVPRVPINLPPPLLVRENAKTWMIQSPSQNPKIKKSPLKNPSYGKMGNKKAQLVLHCNIATKLQL